MTPTEIKTALAKIGGGANKRLGQHFLIDERALEVIVEAADIQRGDHVLEIGPGLGVLTRALLEKGAGVTAIERDRRFAEYLENCHSHESGNPSERSMDPRFCGDDTRLILGDAARLDWDEVVGDRPWKFVSNLPYSISSLALRKALWGKNPPLTATVLVQREVAERAIARDGKTSLLSLMVALASSSAKIVRRVPAGAFFPPPKVESAVLRIIPMSWEQRVDKWGIDPEKIMEIAKRGFAHPRKFLASNLGVDKETVAYNSVQKKRAEELSPEQWAELSKMLHVS